VAGKLQKLKILNPINYYILNKVPTSYQPSVLYDFFIEILDNPITSKALKRFLKEEVLLGHIYEEFQHNGNIPHIVLLCQIVG